MFFPNEFGNANPGLQLTDIEIKSTHKAFNMMPISAAYLKRMGTSQACLLMELWAFPFVFAPSEAEMIISSLLSLSKKRTVRSKVVLHPIKHIYIFVNFCCITF